MRPHLVQLDEKWKEWGFNELIEALRKWTERNPPINKEKQKEHTQREKLLQTNQKYSKNLKCIYCDDEKHKTWECEKVKDIAERRKVISQKKLCFNCLGVGHVVSNCKSKRTCYNCKNRHHSSICEAEKQNSTSLKIESTEHKEVIHPTVLVKVNGIMCRALLDSGSSASFVSKRVAQLLRSK